MLHVNFLTLLRALEVKIVIVRHVNQFSLLLLVASKFYIIDRDQTGYSTY